MESLLPTSRLRYLPRHSWFYRFQLLHYALGWSYPTIAKAIGINYCVIMACKKRARDKNQPLLHFDVIKKILEFEATYKDVVKKYLTSPILLDRTPISQKYMAVKLRPIAPRRPQDIDAVGVLEAHSPAKVEEPESKFPTRTQRERKRAGYARRSASATRTWAEKIKAGWSWHESRGLPKPGRPDSPEGTDGAMAEGAEAPTKKSEE